MRAAGADHLPAGPVLNVGTGVQMANEELVGRRRAGDGAAGRDRGRRAPRAAAWDTADWVCDPTAARELLGWEAKVDLADGPGPLLARPA